MRLGLHQRRAINNPVVKSNGLFSATLFIPSVACRVIDYPQSFHLDDLTQLSPGFSRLLTTLQY